MMYMNTAQIVGLLWMENMEIQWDSENEQYFIKQRLSSGQTMCMCFQLCENPVDTAKWNIALSIYNKRKHADRNVTNAIITGKNPLESFIVARKMFKKLECKVLTSYYGKYYDTIIYCCWVDNRRRDAYYKVLSRYGYDYGVLDGYKVIYKKFPKGTYELSEELK